MSDALRIFVGWDSSQSDAYEVCKFSIERHASIPVEIRPLKLDDLRKAGLYWRGDDPLASTEFTYSRFLTPALAGFEGAALFCDCDFLWLADVAALAVLADPAVAVQCVRHDHRPPEAVKLRGKAQTVYPRKNWSSLMLFNCAHPATRRLTPQIVNHESGSYLHRMQWAADDDIGTLSPDWNWLEGHSKIARGNLPKAIHFTRGGPWLEEWRSAEFADLWLEEKALMTSVLSRFAGSRGRN